MILQYHLSRGHTRNVLLDPRNEKIYFLPKEIDSLEQVVEEYTEYPSMSFLPTSMDHVYNCWLELLEIDLNFERLEQAYRFAAESLCSYLLIRVHQQADLERLAVDIRQRKQNGEFSFQQVYIATTFVPNLTQIEPDPNHFFKIRQLKAIEANRVVRLESFKVRQQLIVQAQHSNLFYDHRLFLDQEGFLKPHPESDYQGAPLEKFMGRPEDLLADKQLTRLWRISREQVETCRNCEFRHVCIDSSDLARQSDGSYRRVAPCNYDPYRGEWGQPTTETAHLA